MAFNEKSTTITIRKSSTTPPDNFLWLKTDSVGGNQRLYKNIGEDRWIPLEASFLFPKDIEDIYDRLRDNQEEINDLKENKQNNLSIASGDKILSLKNDELLSELHFIYSKEDRFIYLKGKNEELIGAIPTDDFIKDGMVDSAIYDAASHSIIITFNKDSGEKIPIKIDLTSLLEEYALRTDQELTKLKDSVSAIEKNYKEADEKILNKITNLTTLNWTNF